MALDIDETIQSQYAASPHIKGLVHGFHSLMDPYPEIKLFYDNIFNLDTARGWGLDVWGRIVGIGRELDGAYSLDQYWGYDPWPGQNDQATGFNQAPFGNDDEGGTALILQDNAYYLLILTKAAANIGTGSLSDLNRQISYLLPNRGAGVINIGTMKIRIYIKDILQPFEQSLLFRGDLPPIPAGVGFEVLYEDPLTFGFDGSDGQPFDQGVFAINSGVPINVD